MALKQKNIIEELISQIEQCEDKTFEIWSNRMEFGRSPQKRERHNSSLREKIHDIDVIEERLFVALWTALEDCDLDDFDVIDNCNFEGKRQYILCDGRIHLVINKRDEFQYGLMCNCD